MSAGTRGPGITSAGPYFPSRTASRSLAAVAISCLLSACAGDRDHRELDAAPATGQVRDGAAEDVDQLDSGLRLAANWDPFEDPERLPVSYEWSLGRSPGATDVMPWTTVSGFRRGDVGARALPQGVRLFTNVRARDLAGNWSQVGSSDGVVIGTPIDTPAATTAAAAASADPAPAPTAPAVPGPTTTIEQHGITWTFARPVECGQFANGDWWVLGPVEIVAITPPSRGENGRIGNGSMLNPDPTSLRQGYDNKMFGDDAAARFDPAANVAFEVTREHPLQLAAGTSLVSTISVAAPGAMPQLETAAVLTCVASAPPANAFRPPYCGTDKTCRWTTDRLDLGRLANLQPVHGAPSLGDLTERFARPWLDHLPGWTGRFAYPRANMPGYGRELADLVGQAALALQLEAAPADKLPLVIAMVQLGIDCHGIVQNGGRFIADGGSGSGRKFPLLLAATLLQDETLRQTLRRYPHAFAEDVQTFVVRETAPGVVNGGHGGYRAEDLGLAEWGQRHADDPSLDQKSWDADPYRRCCTANAWLGYVLATRIMGLRAHWANDALFDYVDRHVQTEPAGSWTRSWSPFAERMWDRYRAAH